MIRMRRMRMSMERVATTFHEIIVTMTIMSRTIMTMMLILLMLMMLLLLMMIMMTMMMLKIMIMIVAICLSVVIAILNDQVPFDYNNSNCDDRWCTSD